MLAGLAGVAMAYSPASGAVGDASAATVCWMTGCSGGGMALSGWALTLGAVLFVPAAWFLFPRCGRLGRIVLLVLGTLTFTYAFLMVPDPRERMSGAGAHALGDGMLWGVGTVVVSAVLLGLGMLINRAYSGSGIVPAMAVSTTLVLGGIFAFADNADEDAVIMTAGRRHLPAGRERHP
ncbi:hypothetical protein [Actinoplanes sp. NPDC051494]|uniref:hypothetical protein n=1 Tax=Actinoplanes sp. NPDC051494 TaxID=3363907 RepID=UPI0037B135D4